MNINIENLSVLWEFVLINDYNCKGEFPSVDTNECTICSDELKEDYVIELPCGHRFHRSCILTNIITYKRKSCPLPTCRKKLISNKVDK